MDLKLSTIDNAHTIVSIFLMVMGRPVLPDFVVQNAKKVIHLMDTEN